MRASLLWHGLEVARRANLADAGLSPPRTGSDGIARRTLLKGLAATALATALPRPARAAGSGPVAIVGGGMAGLSALHTLTRAGIDARLFEARPRLGGRMFTTRAAGLPPIEFGGQLVNSEHDDMRALAAEFGIALIDRKDGAHRTAIVAAGREVVSPELAAGLRGIAGQIDRDSARLDRDYAGVAAELDRLSFRDYLERHARLIPAPWARRLIEATARTEYGVEPDQASALELIFNLPVVEGERIDVLSRADERYLLAGGSGALIEALVASHAARIETGRRLTRIEPAAAGVRLRFVDGGTFDAAEVVVATPAGITRHIDFAVPLSPLWQRFVKEVALGRNEKVQAVMAARPWEAPIGRGGELWRTDKHADAALGWDGTVRAGAGASDGSAGTWTWFLGGDEVARAARKDAGALAKRFGDEAETALPGMAAATIGAVQTAWHRDPFARGAYVNFRPGQLTRFAPLIWTEVDGVANAPVGAGPVHFAGEHLSDAFPGYMNGAAQTGRLAASAIVAGRRATRAA